MVKLTPVANATGVLFYKRLRSCSVRNTAAELAVATTIRLLFFRERRMPTARPMAPLTMFSVAYKMAGKVIAARQAVGT